MLLNPRPFSFDRFEGYGPSNAGRYVLSCIRSYAFFFLQATTFGWNFQTTMKIAIRIEILIIAATAMPAGVTLLPELFLDGVGVASVKGFVGTGVAEVEVMVLIELVEEVVEIVVLVGAEELVLDVLIAGSSKLVVPSSLLSSGPGFGVCVCFGGPSVGSGGVGVGFNTLLTRLSRGSSKSCRSCRAPLGIPSTP